MPKHYKNPKPPKSIRKGVKVASGKRLLKSKRGDDYQPRAQGTTSKVTEETVREVKVSAPKKAKFGGGASGTKKMSKEEYKKTYSPVQQKRLEKLGRVEITKKKIKSFHPKVKRAKK